MLYLITGANGAGKTLNTLKWVRERSLKENRPVCHNGRFEPVEGGELSGWKKIEAKDWQSEPDGTIFLIDECHNDFPLRPPSGTPPEYVRMLAEHRRRGFDFYLVTQHPQNIDSFVRRLIGAPGWHRHLKRTFGADLVSCIEWASVNPNCEKDGSGKTGTVSMVAFPKEVYGWYKSASLHTGKKRIPKPVWVLLACAILVPALGFLGFKSVYGNVTKGADKQGEKAFSGVAAPPSREQLPKMTTAEYIDSRKPRISDFPHTAPAYDKVTEPVIAPYPAACVEMGSRCDCFSQQATVMRVALDTCRQIVKRGYFVDWRLPVEPRDMPKPLPVREEVKVVQVPMPYGQGPSMHASAPSQPVPGQEWAQALAKRNAEVRSVFEGHK